MENFVHSYRKWYFYDGPCPRPLLVCDTDIRPCMVLSLFLYLEAGQSLMPLYMMVFINTTGKSDAIQSQRSQKGMPILPAFVCHKPAYKACASLQLSCWERIWQWPVIHREMPKEPCHADTLVTQCFWVRQQSFWCRKHGISFALPEFPNCGMIATPAFSKDVRI